MKTTQAPDPQQELDHLAPALPILFDAFEQATEKAAQYFESQGRPVNPSLYPHIVRYEVRQFLTIMGHDVEEFEREDLSNNGLCVTIGSRRIRIWKARDDEIPPLGHSPAREAFLNQQLSLCLPEFGPARVIEFNLALLWNIDQNYRFWRFYLVCPRSATSTEVEVYWAVLVPYSGLTAVASQVTSIRTDSGDDLPFSIINDEDEGARGSR